MPQNTFFSKKFCDRCPNKLKSRTLSWFNSEVLCTSCSLEEHEIKKKLIEQGKNPCDYEGCGQIPEV